MIELNRLTKRFGPVTAVDDLSVTVSPGRVTGFLGPNGAGKTITGL
jgi:ABC-2 type transport system ATP-binding protein